MVPVKLVDAKKPKSYLSLHIPVMWEVKLEGEEPSDIQKKRLEQWQKAGGCVGVVTSVEDAKELLRNFIIYGAELVPVPKDPFIVEI